MTTKRNAASSARSRRRRRGFAMLAVLVLSTVGLVFVAIGQRYISVGLTAEEHRLAREGFQEGAVEAMAIAIAKLETKAPNSASYHGTVTVSTSQGDKVFAVRYKETVQGRWEIDVTPYSGTSLNPLPEVFP